MVCALAGHFHDRCAVCGVQFEPEELIFDVEFKEIYSVICPPKGDRTKVKISHHPDCMEDALLN